MAERSGRRPRYEAVLLDFYGTVVHEDDAVIARICDTISHAAAIEITPAEVGRRWWQAFRAGMDRSHGASFRGQRSIELDSLRATIAGCGAACDPVELSRAQFAHWERPPLFGDAVRFLGRVDLPLVVVSNIDRADIETAIAHHRLIVDRVITSEDVRSYKPRPELFLAGLEAVGQPPHRVLHVGDSLSSDVAGANRLGIPVAWVNRTGRAGPATGRPTHEVADLDQLADLLTAPEG